MIELPIIYVSLADLNFSSNNHQIADTLSPHWDTVVGFLSIYKYNTIPKKSQGLMQC